MNGGRSLAVLCSILLVTVPASAGKLEGRAVQDNSGAALSSAEVRVSKAGAPELVADLETDTEGRFQLIDFTPGEYCIEVSKPNYVSRTICLPATDAPTTMLVRLVRYGAVTGQVTNPQGLAVRDALVFAMAKHPDSPLLRRFGQPALWMITGSIACMICLLGVMPSRSRMPPQVEMPARA